MVTTLKHTSITFSEVLEANLRLEANVFNVEAREAKKLINSSKWGSDILKNQITDCFYGARAKRNYIPKSNETIGFVGSSDMLEINPKPTKQFSKSIDVTPFEVKEGMILVSRSGTIGNVTYVNKTLSKFLVSEHAIRIIPKELGGFIYAYFKTDIGRKIVESNTYGAVILQIEPEHLENVIIPNPNKKLKEKIHNLITESFSLRDQSNELIDQAQKLLLAELKLPPIEDLKPDYFNQSALVKSFTVTLDSVNNRFDASYHKPTTTKILDYLFDAGASVKRLDSKELTKHIIQAGRFTRNYVESDYGTVFLGGKQILELDPNNKKYLSTHTHGKQVENDLFIKENMIAVTRSGTIGKVQFVPKHWDNWAMSEHVLRIEAINNDIAGYLYIWLQSDYGKELITRLTYGAVVDEIEEEHLAEVPIPILKNTKTTEQINNLALKANKLRAEAYYKEQEAIKVMNKEVIYAIK